ncbi:hypothetical protein [Candidatus Methylocalor cossyra]|uniref:Transmembrane protein n=1 Tax=Candidatus Methylocalor cossyra TaxID=3108543 RepID=A0ABP1CA82_9GAMM
MSSPVPRRNRAVILVIALLSFVPFALAWYLTRHPELLGATSNYGHLVTPARPLDFAELTARPLNPAAAPAELKGRWVLLQVAAGPCRERCAETLHKTRQVRLMTNKEIPRIRRLLLVPEGAPAGDYAAQLEADPTLAAAGASPPLLASLTEALGRPPDDGTVLLLDPLANLVLWYDPGFDPYGLLKDLKHLLRASQIG